MKTIKLDVVDVLTGVVSLVIAIKNHPALLNAIPDNPRFEDIIGIVVHEGLKHGFLDDIGSSEITEEVKDLMAKLSSGE